MRKISKKSDEITARRYFVNGRVQGVGYRYFVESVATELGLAGYVRNLDDGRVEVYALGPAAGLDQLTGQLRRGPRMSDVRGLEETEAEVLNYSDFRIEYFA